jgi:hypothetical protein
MKQGVIPKEVSDDIFPTLGIMMKRKGYSDEDFIEIHKLYYGDRFDYKETMTQLKYCKRCIA